MTSIHFCNIVDLRSRLKYLAVKNASAPASSLSLFGYTSARQLYIHYWHCYAARLVAEAELLKSNYEPSSRREFKRILDAETPKFFNTVCAYAWCTVNDEDRWENMTDLPIAVQGMVDDEREKLESLSYGLITRFYTPIQRYATYACGYSHTDEIRGFAEQDINYLNEKSFNTTLSALRSNDMTASELQYELKDVSMVVTADDYEY